MIDQNSGIQDFSCPAIALLANFCLPETETWAKVVSIIFCGVEGSSIPVSVQICYI